MEFQTMRELIERALEADPAKTQRGIAAAAHIDATAVSKILSGKRKIGAAEWPKICGYLGIDAVTGEKLAGNVRPSHGDAGKSHAVTKSSLGQTSGSALASSREKAFTEDNDVPILGFVKGGEDDAYYLDQGEIAGYTMRPTVLKGVKDAYAVEIRDVSMEPALNHGHLAWVHPKRSVQPGDYVVVQLTSGQMLCKKLIRRTEREWLFLQHNPKKQLQFPARDVKAVHLIIIASFVRMT